MSTISNNRSEALSSDRLDRVCVGEWCLLRLRNAEVFYLAGLNQILHCAGDILNRHRWINAVLT